MLAIRSRLAVRRFLNASPIRLPVSRYLFSQPAPSATHHSKLHSRGAAKLPFSSPPRSLSLPPESQLRVKDPQPQGIGGFALKLLGYYSKKSSLLRAARTLHLRIVHQVESPALYETFNLEKNFRTTHALLVLHMWMCLARLRAEGKDGSDMGQCLYDVFNEDVEKRVVAAGVKMLFSKWTKELEKMFYGAVLAYDNAMRTEASKDDLAQALWRNVFAEDDSSMPTGQLALPVQSLARYVRREVACLAVTEKESIMSGNILFSADTMPEMEKTKLN